MLSQNDFIAMGGTQIAVGTSSIIRITPGPFQSFAQLQYLSGGSLEIVKAATLTATGLWGTGYLMSTTVPVQAWGPATWYLAATGATAIVQLLIGAGAGATTI